MTDSYPGWVGDLPRVAVNFPGAVGRLMSGPHGQTVFWSFPGGGSVPAHRHGAQMGVVLRGCVRLVVEDCEITYRAGEHFCIDAGQVHSAEISAGSEIIELFEESDRHRAVV